MGPSRSIVAALQFMLIFQTTGLKYAHAYDTCEEIGICDHVEDYPTELVKGLIQELKSKNTVFHYDEPDLSIQSRFNEFREELCESTPQQMVPRRARDSNGFMRTIINDIHDPVQQINIETCNYKKASCTNYLGFIPNYKGVCIQKTALREMYYVDDNNQSAVTHFIVPICCSCKLSRFN